MNETITAELRASGRTTRIVDACIQELFNEGTVTVKDHCDKRVCHENAFDRVVNRLRYEHKHADIRANRNTFAITLIPKN